MISQPQGVRAPPVGNHCLKGMDGSLIVNDGKISKELNKYFLSVFSQEESDRELGASL